MFFFSFFSRKRRKKACLPAGEAGCQKTPEALLGLRNSLEQLPEDSLATRLAADFCQAFQALVWSGFCLPILV